MLYGYWLAIDFIIRMIGLFFIAYQYRHFKKNIPADETYPIRQQRKPEWVKKEIIRLKAFMPHEGCRKIADTFNRLYGDKRKMTVGKSFVYYTIQKHHYEIKVLRRKLKNRTPKPFPKNLVWAMDLTKIADQKKQLHTLFGIVDSGTRASLFLDKVQTKASMVLLRCILDTIENHGKPKIIRTDNEAVFTSRLFRVGLWLLNIKHQRTEVCCPWMNGKIERFFGTLKRKLKLYTIASTETLANDLATYRFWYNHVRTHQHLNGKTPAEVWNKQGVAQGKPIEFSAWDGALTGLYFSPP